jgi:hypothetical protein
MYASLLCKPVAAGKRHFNVQLPQEQQAVTARMLNAATVRIVQRHC